jgi:hypothetical protein
VIGGATFALLGIGSFFVPAIVHLEDNGHRAQDGGPVPAAAEVPLAGE